MEAAERFPTDGLRCRRRGQRGGRQHGSITSSRNRQQYSEATKTGPMGTNDQEPTEVLETKELKGGSGRESSPRKSERDPEANLL